MDVSLEYIKMSDCEVIQKLRPQVMIGSTPHYYEGVYQYEVDSEGVFRHYPTNGKLIWLPRQDELQKMVFPLNSTDTHRIIHQLNVFFDYWDENGIPSAFISWEQLWLAFVMRELHRKVWSGSEWLDG